GGSATADVTQSRPAIGIHGHHPTATAATDKQPREERGARPDHPTSGGGIGGQLLLMALKLLPGNVRRIVILQEDLPLSLRCHAPPGHGAPGLLVPRVRMAPSIDIGPSIHRVVEKTAQRVPCRAAPDQLAFGRTGGEPIRELDPVADTIAQDVADRGLAFELLENEMDHRLHLLAAILYDVTSATPGIV